MVSKIQEGQCLILENLINFRGQVNQGAMVSIMGQVRDILLKNNASSTGGIITVTHNVHIEGGQQVIDFELFCPINKEIPSSGDFKFIPLLEVKNALKISFEGNPQEADSAARELFGYIEKNSFKPVTPVYMVTVKQTKTVDEMNNCITDFYIGVED